MNKIKIITLLLMLISPTLLTYGVGNSLSGLEGNSATPAIKNLTKAEFLLLVADFEKSPTEWKFLGKRPCIIDFYADWCGPCKIVSPILEELAVEFSGKIDIYKVNVDKERELSQVFGIKGIPSMLFCPMVGKPAMTSGISRDKEETKRVIKSTIETLLLKK